MPIVDRAVWRMYVTEPSALLRSLAPRDWIHVLFHITTKNARGDVLDCACGSWSGEASIPYGELALAAAHRGVRPPYVLFDPDRHYTKERADARR